MGALDVIGDLFAGKGLAEHVVGAAGDDPGPSLFGLSADALGVGLAIREDVLEKAAKTAATVARDVGTRAAGELAEKALQRFEAAATPIIEGGLLALNGMQLLLGVTFEQDKGEKFGQASDAMQKVGDTLDAAVPREDWQGSGSTAYAQQNTLQQKRADDVSQTDRKIQGIIAQQAGQVKDTKDTLDKWGSYMTYAIPAAIALKFTPIPPAGEVLSDVFQIGVVAAAMAVCLPKMAEMASDASANAGQIDSAAAKYQEVAAGAQPSGGTNTFDPPPTATQPSTTDGGAPPTTSPTTAPSGGGGAPSSGGGSPSGGGGASSGGGGSPSGGGGASSGGAPSPSAPSMPTMPAMPSAPSGGSSGDIGSQLASAMGSALGGQSGSGGGLGGILSAIPSIVTGAVQAGQQTGQENGQDDTRLVADAAANEAGTPKDDALADAESTETPQPEERGAAAGAGAPTERAPVDSAIERDVRDSAAVPTFVSSQSLQREQEQR